MKFSFISKILLVLMPYFEGVNYEANILEIDKQTKKI